jgi:hypothetical protein|tara:strand:- start:1045 stop:1416 length:372 start_codon:yes stop_codon:yes gene_type:complete
MATLNNRVLDNGLTVLDTEASRVDICSQEPTSYAEATSTYTLGNETSISISAPADASPNGRKVTLAAVSGASVTGTGTATHYAISDTSNSRLLATGSLSASQVVTFGNTFSLTASDIRIPDPA